MYDFQIVDDNGTITYICAKCRSEAIEAYCREKGCSKEYVKEHCIIRKAVSDMADKSTPKEPAYNCQRGMLCPTCDKALWVRIEIKGLFGKKKITVKEQPNFCKYCGQALLPAYSEYG